MLGTKKALFLIELGSYETAIDAFNKLIELNPQNASAWYGKGLVLNELGSYETAIDALNKSIELNPQNGHTWYEKSRSLKLLGRAADAKAAFAMAKNKGYIGS